MRILSLVACFFLLALPTFAQVSPPPPKITLERGEAEVFSVNGIYLLNGEKVERQLLSDYYHTQGSIELDEGIWSMLAVGLGGGDGTLYITTDLAIDAAPEDCIEVYDFFEWRHAFEITCPLDSLNFEVKTGYPYAFLLVIEL